VCEGGRLEMRSWEVAAPILLSDEVATPAQIRIFNETELLYKLHRRTLFVR
jgi:hypothetical protein